MKNVLIEGWRGISQSLAMVNQYQLIELLKVRDLSIFHHDLPYSVASWDVPENDAGFPPDIKGLIASIADASPKTVDTVYRIAFPFARSMIPANKVVTFMVSEFGLRAFQFAERDRVIDRFCKDDDLIVTPSNWSKMKLVEYGFPAEKIRVVPHGVNSDIFFPLSETERQGIRDDLEMRAGEFVFLNLGSLTREKGLSLLISAFAEVRKHNANARLLLKDMRGLYGLELEGLLLDHMKSHGPLSSDVLDSIYLAPSSLSLGEMRLLYGAADVYVSPYRAEGFNLPVIEAIACGIPVIVSEGGATDEFCDPSTALQIECDRVDNASRDYFGGDNVPGYHLEARQDSLVEQMEIALERNMAASEAFSQGRQVLIERFSWRSVVQQLTLLL